MLDASDVGVRAGLPQKAWDGQLRLMPFTTGKFAEAETGYPVSEKECFLCGVNPG